MNENIDLTKILKNCPYGWEFYSSVYGNVQFENIILAIPRPFDYRYCRVFEKESCNNPIQVKADGILREFTSDGRVIFGKGECALFPSYDQRDWSKFTAPWYKKDRFDPKTLQPFDKVLVRDFDADWNCEFFSHIIYGSAFNTYATTGTVCQYCIPYNDETKHLVGTEKEAPEYYRYWED